MTEPHRAGPLFLDLYELTMAASYFAHGVFDTATFPYISETFMKPATILLLQALNKFWMNWQPLNFLTGI